LLYLRSSAAENRFSTNSEIAAMEVYLNDSVESFEFVLQGELAGDAVRRLEQAWITAASILDGKEVVVEVSGMTAADAEGIELLNRMRASGAHVTALSPPVSRGLLRTLGVPAASPPQRDGHPWMSGARRLFGRSG
jgi:hypothetical protein